MALKRVIDLPTINEQKRVYIRINTGTMTRHEDSEGYVLYDTVELENYKPRKRGRKPNKPNK